LNQVAETPPFFMADDDHLFGLQRDKKAPPL
jgi:hypothetical protein